MLGLAVLRLFVFWPCLGIVGLIALILSRWTKTAHTALVAIIYASLMVCMTLNYSHMNISDATGAVLDLVLSSTGLLGAIIFAIKEK